MLREGWCDLEERIEDERGRVENDAAAEVAAGRPERGAEIVSDFMQRSVDAALSRAQELLVALNG